LNGKASPNELDRLEAQIRLVKQEAHNIESKSNQLKLAMYDTNQTNAALQAEIQQKREKTNFKDHNIATISGKVNMIFNALDRSIYTLHCRTH
jgi:chromosome segregation ATPase